MPQRQQHRVQHLLFLHVVAHDAHQVTLPDVAPAASLSGIGPAGHPGPKRGRIDQHRKQNLVVRSRRSGQTLLRVYLILQSLDNPLVGLVAVTVTPIVRKDSLVRILLPAKLALQLVPAQPPRHCRYYSLPLETSSHTSSQGSGCATSDS